MYKSKEKSGNEARREGGLLAAPLLWSVRFLFFWFLFLFEWKMCRRCEYETLHTHTHTHTRSFFTLSSSNL